ncbi:dTDP-4-dehydrorhamnose reductase [Maribacter sp.]|uniref:dTDP-4-dehydrorhamnose reductase n=1 Tax=Maribacter sp. TaxID=1897614 RepID=UPI0032992C24
MKKVLVTGANGQLGQCLQKIAAQFKNLEFTFKNSKDLDITDVLSIKKSFDLVDFDYCINCAAYTDVEQAEKTPDIAFRVNAEGVKNLAFACKKHEVGLIHISTDYVFDGEKKEPYFIEDIPNPINEYGKSKLLGEKYIQEIMDDYCIIRTSWLYSGFGKNFYTTILNIAKVNHTLKISNTQVGYPTNALNLAKFINQLVILANFDSNLYHFTDKVEMTWFEFAKKILKTENLSNKVIIHNDKSTYLAARPINSRLD